MLEYQKTIKDCCKEVVEKKQEEGQEKLAPIKTRLTGSAQNHQIDIDCLVKLAELECKKALGDMYYGNEEEQEAETVNKEEMMTIAKVAYSNIMHDEGEQNASTRNSTVATSSENTERSQPAEPSENDPLLSDTQ